jgi:hypothetical protein
MDFKPFLLQAADGICVEVGYEDNSVMVKYQWIDFKPLLSILQ